MCKNGTMVALDVLLGQEALHLVPVDLPRSDAEVRWVATSELTDPSPFLEGGEVMLTTGLNTAGWRSQWNGYVARLADAGVAALGIGTGLTHRHPPSLLVRACREHGVNLFEVPRKTTFVAISRVAARLIEEREQTAARETVQMQRELTQAALHRDISALLDRLAGVVHGGVCTTTREGLLDEGPFGPLAASLDLEDVRVEVVRMRPLGLRAASSLMLDAVSTVVQPLGLRGRPESYLAVLTPSRLAEGQRSAVTTAVALLSLAVESRIERRETERRLRGRALELLVQADARTATVVLAALRGNEPDEVSLPALVQMLRANGPVELLDDALTTVEDQSLATELSARVGGELWVAVSPGRSASLASALAESGLRVGVGSAVPVDEAAGSHETAGHALRQTTAASPVLSWDQLVGEGALALIDRGQAAAFADAFLARLEVHGFTQDDLVATLASFLRHHGSRGRVAAELGVHRNTVRNRLERIESALGRSLDDPQTRVNAWIALQVGGTH